MRGKMLKRQGNTIAPTTLITIALIGCVALTGCGERKREEKSQIAPNSPQASPGQAIFQADSPKLAQIRSEAVQVSVVPVGGVTAPGKVEANANRLSHVVLPVPGHIMTVLVKIGDFVREGQPLFTLESADLDAAVSGYQQAQASVTQAKSAVAKAQRDLDRVKDLYEHGANPQKEVFNAEAMLVQAQTAVEQNQATIEQARRRLQILGIEGGKYGQRMTINAPIPGKVLELSVVNGEFRNDLSAPLMTIADLSSVWVTSDVPETSIRFIRTGEPMSIELSAYPSETFRGRVALIGDTVDPQTRTVQVRAELSNPNSRLKPEMFGNVQLAERSESRPTVPVVAVIATAGKSMVWREIKKGVFERVAVTTGVQVGDRIAILEGLNASDRVVVDGVMLLVAN